MKFAKLLPITMSLMLAASIGSVAMADPAPSPSHSATQNLDIVLPEYIDIREATDLSKLSANALFTEDYNTLTLDDNLHLAFDVTTNKNSKKIKLTATAAGNSEALRWDTSTKNFRLAFANTTVPATSDDVIAALDTKTKETNPNVIVFRVTPVVKYDSVAKLNTHATGDSSLEPTGTNTLTYTLVNGKYLFDYDIPTGACENNTFSTRDQSGTYEVTLLMTDEGV